MKRIIYTLAFFVATTVAAMAQNNELPEVTNNIKFKEVTWDFGNVNEGEKPTHEFLFTNIGKEPVILQNAVPSCGCTTPAWTKEPIMPGKNGNVTATYNSQGRPGVFTKSITVKSNFGDVMLTIKGNVIQKPEEKVSPLIQK